MDIETIRLRSEFLALEILTVQTVRALADAHPSFAQSLREQGNLTTERLSRLAIPRAPTPEQADLLSSELQEAWERLLQRVLKQP